jgi:hypothetical protein
MSDLQADQTPKAGAPNAFEKQGVDQPVVDKSLDELSATVVAEIASDSQKAKMVSTNIADLLTVHDQEKTHARFLVCLCNRSMRRWKVHIFFCIRSYE